MGDNVDGGGDADCWRNVRLKCMTLKTIRVVIAGRVQGVWFRGWTAEQATRLELSGWVRNRPDGGVEALFHGVEDTVDQMLSLCWIGPGLASVSDVSVTPETPFEGHGFEIVRTV